MPCRCATILLLASIAVSLAGCGGGDALNSPTALKMKGLANAYLDHVVSANGPPADESALKKHMKGLRGSVQYDYHINPDNIDASFVSERDKEPLVIDYGK